MNAPLSSRMHLARISGDLVRRASPHIPTTLAEVDHIIFPARSSQKSRKAAARRDQKVFGRFLDTLWADSDFAKLHRWAATKITPIFGQLDLAWPLAIGLEVADAGVWVSDDESGVDPNPWRASPEVASTIGRLVGTLRPHVQAICTRVHAAPTGRSLLWATVALLWPGESAREQYEQLKDNVGTLSAFSVHTGSAALEPEPDAPEDVLQREGIALQAEVRRLMRPSPFDVPLTQPGRRHGSGTFESAEAFKVVVGTAVLALREQKKNPTTTAVLRHLRTRLGDVDSRQLTRWHQEFGWPTWEDFLRDL